MLQNEIVRQTGPQPILRSGGKGQVLVVDDSHGVREVLTKTLSFLGYDVTPAGNGIEAWRLFLTGSYDLVITGLEMPLLNGWDLSRLIKARSPSTPVVVISDACDETQWKKINMSCVESILLKPFTLEDIEGTVRRLLNNGT